VEGFVALRVKFNAYPSVAMHVITSFPYQMDLWYTGPSG